MSGPLPFEITAQLAVKLDQFSDAFKDAGENIQDRQFACLGSLVSVLQFFESDPALRAALDPLRTLAFALQRVSAGGSDRLFEGTGSPSGGRSLDASQIFTQSNAVGAVSLMIECGWSEKVAVTKVAGVLGKAGQKGRSGKLVTSDTVRKWRANLASGDFPTSQKSAQRFVSIARSNWENSGGSWPPSKDDAAKMILSVLPILIRPGIKT